MEKILSNGVYCCKCKCFIDDNELVDWECGQCDPNLTNWENVEVVMRSSVIKALNNLEKAAEKISRVNAEQDEY
jgi:hypothetical protein